MEEERNYSVYKHTSPNGKIYIGITKQKLENRWRNGKGYKNNDYFTRAIDKYGWDNFNHEIVWSKLTEEEAKIAEINLIKKYQSSNSDYGYNITLGGESCNGLTGKKHPLYGTHWSIEQKEHLRKLAIERYKNNPVSKQTREKLSNSCKGKNCGKKRTEDAKNKMSVAKSEEKYKQIARVNGKICSHPVVKFDTEGNLIQIYNSITEASEKNSIPFSSISDCCRHRKGIISAYSFKWLYYSEYQEMSDNELSIFKNQTIRERKNKRKVICLNTLEVFNSILEASQKYKCSVSNVVNKKQKTSGKDPLTGEKLEWMFYEDYIQQIA